MNNVEKMKNLSPSWIQYIPGITHTLHSNYGITLVIRNNASWVEVSKGSLMTHVSHSFTSNGRGDLFSRTPDLKCSEARGN